MLALRLAFRNVLRHKIRSAMTLGAMAFGCTALIFAGGFFEDIYFKLQENEIRTHNGHLQITRNGFRAHGGADPYAYLIENAPEVIAKIEAIPGVRFATPRLPFDGLLSTGETSVTFMGLGLDPDKELMQEAGSARAASRHAASTSGTLITAGELLSASEPTGAVGGETLLNTLDAKPGTDLILLTRTIDDSVSGSDIRVRGAMRTGVSELDRFALRLPIATAQSLLRTTGVQSIVVQLERTADTPRIQAQVNDVIKREGWDLETVNWRDLSDFAIKSVHLFERWYLVLKIIIGLIVLLSIYNTIAMSVIERTVEIGTARAIGDRRADIVKSFLLEGAMLGFLGGLVGVAAGSLVTFVVGRIGFTMAPSPGFTLSWMSEPIVSGGILLQTFFLALIAATASAILPALRAARLEIAQALRYVG